MSLKQKMQVLGVKPFKGTIEGTSYDQTKLLVALPFPSNSKSFGMDIVAMVYGDSAVGEKLGHLHKFPGEYELEIEATTKGYEVLGFSVVKP